MQAVGSQMSAARAHRACVKLVLQPCRPSCLGTRPSVNHAASQTLLLCIACSCTITPQCSTFSQSFYTVSSGPASLTQVKYKGINNLSNSVLYKEGLSLTLQLFATECRYHAMHKHYVCEQVSFKNFTAIIVLRVPKSISCCMITSVAIVSDMQ